MKGKLVVGAGVLGGSFLFATSALAGTHGYTTCTESFARWHTEIPQPPGGYVAIDFGSDGVTEYHTTRWQSNGDGKTAEGLGNRFEGSSIRVTWYDGDGVVILIKGKGVIVNVDVCTPDTTIPDTTIPDTTIPDTTIPVVDTTIPDTTIVVTTVPTSDSTTPVDSTVVTTAPQTVPSSIVTYLCPDPNGCLPATGSSLTLILAVIGSILLVIGTRIWFWWGDEKRKTDLAAEMGTIRSYVED